MSTCAHCGHTRLPEEPEPATHCPACGIEYGQRADLHVYQIDDRPPRLGIPRGWLIGGGSFAALCLLGFLAFSHRERPWEDAGGPKPDVPAPIPAVVPTAPTPAAAPAEEPSEGAKRLAHELWLSMAFAERTSKEFQRFADSPLDQLGERSDALFTLKRDWDEMILSNPCIAATKPILSSALGQASDAVTAKRLGDPNRAAITSAAADEYARFVQAVQACKGSPVTAAATDASVFATPVPPAADTAPGPSAPATTPAQDTGRLDQEIGIASRFITRWEAEMEVTLELLDRQPRPLAAMAAREDAFASLKMEWQRISFIDPCVERSRPLYDEALGLALAGTAGFRQDKPEHVQQLTQASEQQLQFVKALRACKKAAGR